MNFSPRMSYRKRVQPLMAFAAAHLDGDLSLATLARRVGISTFHLQRAFTASVGESAKQFTQRLRLDRAASQLLTCCDSVLTIALSSGFANHETFTRAFRRRFGIAPIAYRRRGLPAGLDAAQAAAHAEWVRTIGPCIQVFYRRPDGPPRGVDMAFSVTRKELSAQPVLVVRQRIKRTDIAATLAQQLGRIFVYAQSSGAALAGQPFMRYFEWGPGMLLVEAGLPVAVATRGEGQKEGDIKADTLPGGLAAVTTHRGPYETLADAHAAVQIWIADEGLHAGAAPWEVYVTDPAEYPDPKDWKTEVIWPLNAP